VSVCLSVHTIEPKLLKLYILHQNWHIKSPGYPFIIRSKVKVTGLESTKTLQLKAIERLASSWLNALNFEDHSYSVVTVEIRGGADNLTTILV